MCNVSKGRVTQWVDEGKITGAGLIGEGRSQEINPEIALRQLKERRAVNESCGLNGLNTNLDPKVVHTPPPEGTTPAPEPLADAPTRARGAPPPDGEDPETVDARIKAEKLKQNEILTRRQEMEELTRHGKWLLASDVAGEFEPPGRGNGPYI